MKKSDIKKPFSTNTSVSVDHSAKVFEIFKSRVANAVLDYMEEQSDLDLLDCLEKSSMFLTNISVQMEKVFHSQNQSIKDQNDLFELGDDLFSASQQTSSNTIH
tara:strand:+ start:230 stop:541 length:312 start_codon:yes stop_codon:yes gene_type:complete